MIDRAIPYVYLVVFLLLCGLAGASDVSLP